MATIQHKGYTREEQNRLGSKFLISNGFLGYRGTLDEADSSDYVALNLNGVYDGHFKESVNVYNPLYTMIKADGIDLNPKSFRPKKHIISLDTDNGVFRRHTDFKYGSIEISLKSERFVDQINKQFLYSKLTFKTNAVIDVEIFSGIDDFIWNINENHLVNTTFGKKDEILYCQGKTKHSHLDLVVMTLEDLSFKAKTEVFRRGILKHTLQLEPNTTYTITKYAGIAYGNNIDIEQLSHALKEAIETGYQKLYKKNEAFWSEMYQDAMIDVFNNDHLKAITEYATYQLLAHRPIDENHSIPQKGLSGQFEMGAVSWMTETLLLPFYINTYPALARHMVMYRVKSLELAKKKAASLGYEGAFFAEHSGHLGEEINPQMVNNHIHINGSIIYGLFHYIDRTRDYEILFEGAMELMLECSRFYLSYATLSDNKKHYDFLGVQGLDSIHDSVDNEAFTNMMIKNCFDATIKCVAFAKQVDKFRVKDMFDPHQYEDLITEIRALRRKMYLKKENIEYLLEAFDNYFDLEDVDISTLKRINFLEETKIEDLPKTSYVKNANVIALLALFSEEYSNKIKAVNYDYYMRRSINPSPFIRLMMIINANEIGLADDAYKLLEDLLSLELDNAALFNDGLDLTILGSLYVALVYGFSVLRHHGYLVSAEYNQTSKFRRLEYKVKIAQNVANIKIKRNSVSITWNDE